MSSMANNEKINPTSVTDVILAEKTLEILRIIEMSDVLIRSKFKNDTAHWMDAVFHILMLRNSAYLLEERDSCSESQCRRIHDDLLSLYSKMESSKENTGTYDCKNYSDFISTSNSLIKLFSKFTSLLVKKDSTVINGASEVDNCCGTSSTVPLSSNASAADNNINGRHIPTKGQNTSNDGEIQTKTKLNRSNTPILSNKKPPAKDGSTKSTAVSMETSNNKSTTLSKPSRSLSEGDRSQSVDSLSRTVPNLLNIEMVRKHLDSALGEASNAIEVLSNRDFYCKVCDCQVSSLSNVAFHVTGKQHASKANINKKGKTVKQKGENQNQSIVTENVEKGIGIPQTSKSTSGRTLLQISSTVIPVKHLEL